MDDNRLRDVLAVLVEEIGALKVAAQDSAAIQTQHSADIRNLAAGITATRRALDPEALGKHVAKNIDDFLGDQVELLARAVRINHDAARQAADLAAKLKDVTAEAETANRGLRSIATRIEAHAGRSKWDFAVLAAGMAVAALLAGAGAVYWTKQSLGKIGFQDAVQLIKNDRTSYWCGRAGSAKPIQDATGKYFCPVRMEGFQGGEEEGD
ncbi:hypothetical protein [Falsigemmobacter faecalis]|uniref:Uncharacterized protein n=1 Tax=Falsigemmobacter faecalis TaxID=2488730 RepID=A0A3P3D9N6_9RHOB|nr:hypothetical protein [Falsigemmobacter faecalis]RRH71065.1 hypothetical protein EG244_16845 [Falsigemmobacter faecalis]